MSAAEPVQVEAIIDHISPTHITARLHETDRKRVFDKTGVKFRFTEEPYVILPLSERRAIDYNLV